MKVTIVEDQKDFYSPFRIYIDDTEELNRIADARQKAHGKVTYFDDTNPDNDYDGWYNFIIDTDGEKVTKMYYEDEAGNYIDSIAISEEDKMSLMEQIIEYFGGREAYETVCKEWRL